MIAVDTSSLVAYLEESTGRDVELIEEALLAKQIFFPPVVLTELLSDHALPSSVKSLFRDIPLLEVADGYWQRAGSIRALVLSKGHKARVADSLIAQSCLDHKIGLITRDKEFKAFAKLCGLILVQ